MGFQILAWGSTRVSLRISLLSALCLCPFDEDDYMKYFVFFFALRVIDVIEFPF